MILRRILIAQLGNLKEVLLLMNFKIEMNLKEGLGFGGSFLAINFERVLVTILF